VPMDDELSEILDFFRACPEWDHNWLLLSPQSCVPRPSSFLGPAASSDQQRPFVREQPTLIVEAACVTSQCTAATDDAMTGYQN
jgi:hypothetical protein